MNMEEKNELPKERTKDEILHSRPIVSNNKGSDLYVSLESARIAMQTYADQYVAKLHQAETYNGLLKNEIQHLNTVIEKLKEQATGWRPLLEDILRDNNNGYIDIDEALCSRIKKFLYGE